MEHATCHLRFLLHKDRHREKKLHKGVTAPPGEKNSRKPGHPTFCILFFFRSLELKHREIQVRCNCKSTESAIRNPHFRFLRDARCCVNQKIIHFTPTAVLHGLSFMELWSWAFLVQSNGTSRATIPALVHGLLTPQKNICVYNMYKNTCMNFRYPTG